MLVLASALALEPAYTTQSIAVELCYTYVEVGYRRFDVSGQDESGDGIGLSGSFALDDTYYLFGGLGYAAFSLPSEDFDTTTLTLGGGFHAPVGARTDGLLEFALLMAEVDGGVGDGNEDGWSIAGGVRHRLSDKVEIAAKLGEVYLDDHETFLEADARFYFNERASLGLEIVRGEESDSIGLSFRIEP